MDYVEFKNQIDKKISAFPLFFAFNKDQFKKGMEELNITDESLLCSILGGGFLLKSNVSKFMVMFKEHEEELERLCNDKDFLIEALIYELNNHEYCYTHDTEPALDALGIEIDNDMKKDCLAVALTKVYRED